MLLFKRRHDGVSTMRPIVIETMLTDKVNLKIELGHDKQTK